MSNTNDKKQPSLEELKSKIPESVLKIAGAMTDDVKPEISGSHATIKLNEVPLASMLPDDISEEVAHATLQAVGNAIQASYLAAHQAAHDIYIQNKDVQTVEIKDHQIISGRSGVKVDHHSVRHSVTHPVGKPEETTDKFNRVTTKVSFGGVKNGSPHSGTFKAVRTFSEALAANSEEQYRAGIVKDES